MSSTHLRIISSVDFFIDAIDLKIAVYVFLHGRRLEHEDLWVVNQNLDFS